MAGSPPDTWCKLARTLYIARHITVNKYYRDSEYFFQSAAVLIRERMEKKDLICATMQFALAIERALKGIIFDVNPVYVLIDNNFKNAVAVAHQSEIKHLTSEVSQNPNSDVITYRNSLLRAEVFSDFAHDNKSLLFFLSTCRDVIAHNDLDIINIDKIKTLLLRDFFRIASSVAELTGINIHRLVAQQDNRLATLSAKHQDSVEEKLAITLANHKKKWDVLKKTKGYAEDKAAVTDEVLRTPNKFPIECPACGQKAALYCKPETEPNPYMGTDVITGYFITRVKCQFCKLDISEYDEIEFLNRKCQFQEGIRDLLQPGTEGDGY